MTCATADTPRRLTVTGLNLGPDFETDVATLASITSFDPGSLNIALLNPSGGPTTVRLTVAINIDTTELKALIQKHSA
jgi:hypothetical protein